MYEHLIIKEREKQKKKKGVKKWKYQKNNYIMKW
jgi:hypothetical protein